METLKQRRDFLKVSASSFKYVSSAFILQARSFPQCESRYGLTASKKVGGAVERNFAKRRLRVLVREVLKPNALTETYYVIIARPELLKINFQILRSDFQKALQVLNHKMRGE